jgi:hypothetical protein
MISPHVVYHINEIIPSTGSIYLAFLNVGGGGGREFMKPLLVEEGPPPPFPLLTFESTFSV